MIYLKAMISILIIILSSLLGKNKGYRYKKREELLLELEKLLKRIQIEMSYTENKIDYIIEKSVEDLDKEIVHNIYNVDEIEYLKEKDKKIIKEYIRNMGKKDIESELALLEQTKQEISIQIEDAIKEKSSNMKLYEKLGALIGIGIVIAII